MGLLELLEPQRKTFLKTSRSESSAPWALEGLGTWGLIPTFLRYSKPRSGHAPSPNRVPLCYPARHLRGPLHIPPPSEAGGGPHSASRSCACPSSSSNTLSLAPGLAWRRSPRPSTPHSL